MRLNYTGACWGAGCLSFRLRPADPRNCRNHCVSEPTEKRPRRPNSRPGGDGHGAGISHRPARVSRAAHGPFGHASTWSRGSTEAAQILFGTERLEAGRPCRRSCVRAGLVASVGAGVCGIRRLAGDVDLALAKPLEMWRGLSTVRRTAWRMSRGCAGGPQGCGARAPARLWIGRLPGR